MSNGAVTTTRRQPSSPLIQRAVFGLSALALAVLTVIHHAQDARGRRAADALARKFHLERRHRLLRLSMRLEPAADLGLALVADAIVRDAQAALASEAAKPRPEQASQRDFAAHLPQLREARSLMLEALASRPGWFYHRFLLGQLGFAEWREARSRGMVASPEFWLKPLVLATRSAPGSDTMWGALGSGYLEVWSELSAEQRAEAASVLRRAFLDAEFVSRSFSLVLSAFGARQALSLLPEIPASLSAALEVLKEKNEVFSTGILYTRWDRAERRQRAADLRFLERTERLGDLESLRKACVSWTFDHPVGDFDDPLGRSQAARVLELWPSVPSGPWDGDPRGELVRFFLNGREADIHPGVLARSIEALSSVPEPIQAYAKLLSGDRDGAEELAKKSERFGPLDWTPYFLALAKKELKEGEGTQARAALRRVAWNAREDCDVLLARRDVERALGDRNAVEIVERRLETIRVDSYRPGSWSDTGTLSLCLDPEWSRKRMLTVELEAERPTMIAYGWDGGRKGVMTSDSKRFRLHLPLTGLSGRRHFWLRTLAGGPATPASAALTENGPKTKQIAKLEEFASRNAQVFPRFGMCYAAPSG